MFVTLIGLSGCGKSHLSKKLSDSGEWELIACDSRIEQRLDPYLRNTDGSGTRRVAEWLGQPFDPGFHEREQLYLSAEHQVVAEALAELEAYSGTKHFVVDATGSVIYLPQELHAGLRRLTTVVYLQVPDEDSEQMFRQYLDDPKPVIWRDLFSAESGESHWNALARSYRSLLRERTSRYERLAHKTLRTSFAERASINQETLMKVLQA